MTQCHCHIVAKVLRHFCDTGMSICALFLVQLEMACNNLERIRVVDRTEYLQLWNVYAHNEYLTNKLFIRNLPKLRLLISLTDVT